VVGGVLDLLVAQAVYDADEGIRRYCIYTHTHTHTHTHIYIYIYVYIYILIYIYTDMYDYMHIYIYSNDAPVNPNKMSDIL